MHRGFCYECATLEIRMQQSDMPTILVIIGITGDLSKRKLLPAIEQIVAAGAAPNKLKIVGVTRQAISADEIMQPASHDFLKDNLEIFQMDMSELDEYTRLANHLTAIEEKFERKTQRLFYLSIPPGVSDQIVSRLGQSGLAKISDTKLLLEKPFGTDLDSAQDLVDQIKHYFDEEQIYRIDHYLAKEMAQNFIVFRTDNSLFKRTWNKDFIESIEIIASEKIGIEGRAAFYEQTGALRDLVQSHLLQLAALTLMETPKPEALNIVPELRLAVLKQLRLANKSVQESVIRGQYDTYAGEVNNPKTQVETYVDVRLESVDPRWSDVPIRLMTGKGLKQKKTEIRVRYRQDEHHEANELVIRIQPDESIELHVWAKVPGYERKVEKHALKLVFKEHYGALPEAYEQVLLDAINSNHSLFTSSDEVLETWRIISPIQKAWEMDGNDLAVYPFGTDGPAEMIK